ncbi:MAG: DUF1223 domain-containing protein [Stellaceae bacterium]
MRKLAALVALAMLAAASPLDAAERPIVVELFTSEGCSSCPPADALLAELANRPDVLALSFHVDYWDRLGWKDPFSSAAATDRQRNYANLLRTGTVYTPQVVVDGRWQAVGSDRDEVEQAIGSAHRSEAMLPVALAFEQGRARITIGAGNQQASGSVVLIGFDRRHVDAIKGGENDGRTLAHVDVVRGMIEAGRFDGKAATIEVPLAWQADRIAALVEAADGRILGAAVADSGPF